VSVGSGRLGEISKKAGRTGIPVAFARPRALAVGKNLSVAGKLTAAAVTKRPTRRLARPGTALGSKARVGMRRRMAAIMAGPEA